MKTAIFFLVVLVICGVYAQDGTFERLVIDNFNTNTSPTTFMILQFDPDGTASDTVTTTLPASRTDFAVSNVGVNDPDLIGGERDVELTLTDSPENRITQLAIDQGTFTVNQPNDATGEAIIQWDGIDGTMTLDTNGLSNADLTDGGLAYRINTEITTDIACVYTFTFYSPDGRRCEIVENVPGQPNVVQNIVLDYDDFDTNNCDMSNIGAVELTVDVFDNVDTITSFVTLIGDPDPSPSTTPSAIPNPSASTTPSTIPLPSGSPSPSPSNSPIVQVVDDDDDCHCYCPAFTCALIFDPDDDENDAYYFDDDDVNRGNPNTDDDDSVDDDDTNDDDNDDENDDDNVDDDDNGDDDDNDDDDSSVVLSVSMAVLFVCFALLF